MKLTCRHCKKELDEQCFKKDKRRQFFKTNGRRDTCYNCEYSLKAKYLTYPDDHPDMVEKTRICNICLVEKPLNTFQKTKVDPLGRTYRCKDCYNKQVRDRRHANGFLPRSPANPKTSKQQWLLYSYGLSELQFTNLLDSQNGKCAICLKDLDKNSRQTCVDHCHKTDIIRGILCGGCNSGIGMLKENITTMLNAINYLNQFNKE